MAHRAAAATTTLAGLLCAFLLASPLHAEQQLPSGFVRCPKDDGAFAKCMVNGISAALKTLGPGIPSFGLPVLDPLHVPLLGIGQPNANSPVNLNITLTDLYIYGLSKAMGSNFKSNLNKYQISGEGHAQQLYLEADYIMDGKVLVLPVTGKGRANANITNIHAKLALQGEENIKNGKKYMKVTDFTVDLSEVEHISLYFGNLFNGDKALGESTNAVINDNWREFWNELRPPFEETLRHTFKEFARRLFNRVAYDDAFES